MRRKSLLGAAGGGSVLMLSLLMLGGCGGLIGKGPPADLYRFGVESEPAPETPAMASPVRSALVSFPGASFPAAMDNRILTVSGTKVMYIANSRWAASASELFDAALVHRLEENAPEVRLLRREQLQRSDLLLLVDVRHFEAQYAGDEKAPPDIEVEARVRLLRQSDRATVGEWTVRKTEHAGANHVTSIVDAFDEATKGATREIADLVRGAVQQDVRPQVSGN
jgi:cholesterol transport system auxiliary component